MENTGEFLLGFGHPFIRNRLDASHFGDFHGKVTRSESWISDERTRATDRTVAEDQMGRCRIPDADAPSAKSNFV